MKILGGIAVAIMTMAILVQGASALMTSTNYRLYGDSIGSAGGRGSSTNYLLEGTSGEGTIAGEGQSTNYTLMAGFQSLVEYPTFTFSVSESSLSLGSLSTGSVSTGSYTVTTSTNAPFGYTTYIYEDADLMSGGNDIDDVSDSSVTAGSEEYGVAVSGTDAAFATDEPITTTALAIASRTNWVNGSATTVTHKASMASNTTSGSYSHTITLMSVGNF